MNRWRALLDRLRARMLARRAAPPPDPPRRLRNTEPPRPGFLHGRVSESTAWQRLVRRRPPRW